MTEGPRSLPAAIERRDITLALTPGQLIVALVAIWLLVRFLRSLRR